MNDLATSIPYCRHDIGAEEIQAVLDVLGSGWIARGPLARDFEDRCADRLGASHAISCTNGSAALELALRALGIGPGDEVIVPTLTWVATAMAVRLVGATPVFCDIDPDTLCASAASAETLIDENTRAAIVVDFAGIPHDAPAWRELADAHGIALIDDGAHAFGAAFPDGTPVGGDGKADITTFSFHPAKTITTGEGGLVTTGDDALAARLRTLRSGGIERGFEGSRGGWDIRAVADGSNHHLTEIQAALGLVQLERLGDFIAGRREAAQHLCESLGLATEALQLPRHPEGSSWNLFIAQLVDDAPDSTRRDALVTRLHELGVRAHVHYPLLHTQPLFAESRTADLLNAARHARRGFTLPLFPGLTGLEIQRITEAVSLAVSEEALAVAGPDPRNPFF